ncbi:MAG: substrate-binding domain-containing protein [Eubacterium sp.]|nr:substrate-binding domain-containing protein [Eubacterium sp.]
MATIKEIAEKAGVSIGTVDRVLHDRGMVNAQTKERIEAVMRELDYRPNQAAQGLAVRKKKLKISFLLPDTQNHLFFAKVACAAREKAKELEQYGVQVNFYQMNADEMFSYSKWTKFQDSLAEQDGIIMMGIGLPEVLSYLDQAAGLKIPVVFYNTYIPDREFLAYVGCDYEKAGRLAAGLSALAGGEDARVCIYSEGLPDISSHEERVEGFCREAAERYPEMKILAVYSIEAEQEKNEQSVQEMFRKFPDINVVYVVNPRDYDICRIIAQADLRRQVRIITNDLVEEQADMIRQGTICATICQEPEKQGAMSLDILFQYLAYGTIPEERMQHTNLSIHIAQNL